MSGITPQLLDELIASGISVEELAAIVVADIEEKKARKARSVPWLTLRAMAFERDGECCRYCGDEAGPFEVDHVVPRAKGGENVLDNVVVSCRRCNRSKKDREAPKP